LRKDIHVKIELEAIEHRLQKHHDRQRHAQIMLESQRAIQKAEMIMTAEPLVRSSYLASAIVPLSQTC